MESKNKLINLAIIIGTFIICVIIIMLLANILSIMKYKDATFYVIDNDKIPTITTVVGKGNTFLVCVCGWGRGGISGLIWERVGSQKWGFFQVQTSGKSC